MSQKIIKLELENVKRVRAVEISPSPVGLTTIGGKNCQGKTSILDAITYALGGEKYRPSNLQREGSSTEASIRVTMSNGLVVERSGKNAALKVIDPSGARGGQRLLDSFFLAVSYKQLRAHETGLDIVCRLLLEKKKNI